MPRFRKSPPIIVVLILLAVGLTATLRYALTRRHANELEQWLGRHIVGVVEGYISPEVTFSDLDYQFPGQVTVDDLTLTCSGQTIVKTQRMVLELAEVPRVGKPIQVKRIELQSPTVRFIHVPEGGLLGWSDFVRPGVVKDPASVPQGRRFSDVLVLRHVEIHNGQVTYEPGGGQPTMRLDGIELVLDTPPIPEEPGSYRLDGTLSRDGCFAVSARGRVNLDAAVLSFEELKLDGALGEEGYGKFPPGIQDVLRRHEVAGGLTATARLTLPLHSPRDGELNLGAHLSEARVTFGQYVLPVRSLDWMLTWAKRMLEWKVEGQLLGGRASTRGSITLSGNNPVEVTWEAQEIAIERSLRGVGDGAPAQAGQLRSQGVLKATLDNWPGSVTGSGTVEIENGRLTSLPLVADLLGVLKIALGRRAPSYKDRALFAFDLAPDHLCVNRLELISPLIAVRGSGKIYYDRRLDLKVHAGPVEKLEITLGPIGDLLAPLTHRMIMYRVQGTLTKVQVRPEPLGIGVKP